MTETDLTPCVYCGEIATTVDHVPPQTCRDRFEQCGRVYAPDLVPACRECNSMLRTDGWTIMERKRLIKEKIRKRYAKYLAIPPWSEEELRDLGPFARAQIVRGLNVQRHARARLAW